MTLDEIKPHIGRDVNYRRHDPFRRVDRIIGVEVTGIDRKRGKRGKVRVRYESIPSGNIVHVWVDPDRISAPPNPYPAYRPGVRRSGEAWR